MPNRLHHLAVTLLFTVSATAQTHTHRAAITASPTPDGPTAYIDTTQGRFTCKLFPKLAPLTVATFIGLSDGTKDWTDDTTNTVVHGKPFYDAVAIAGVSDGILAGDRLGAHKGEAGPPVPTEKNALTFDKPGLLVMAKRSPTDPKDKTALNSASVFYITDHADEEYKGRGGTIFGQCDDASVQLATTIAHTLLSTDNHPTAPVGINHISITHPGEPAPPIAADVASAAITPQPVPMPVDPIATPQPAGPTAIIDTTMGTFTCKLFKETPLATANFIGLTNGTKDWKNPKTKLLQHGKRFYDGLSFRRVIPDFMIQQSDLPGDPGGDGDIGFHFVVENVPGLSFDRPGRLAYANAGPDTNESEFFITEHPIHRLDSNYTIFGQCDDASVKLVEAVARVPRDAHNNPLKPVTIRKVTIQ
jgi:cyclophilin family peptidyl-prolyl cis-trans isomerase